MDDTMPKSKSTAALSAEEEPRLAQALVGTFSGWSAARAAALFTRAAWLALHQPHAEAKLQGSAKHKTAVEPAALASLDVVPTSIASLTSSDPRMQAVQRLVDQSEFRRFDKHMEASISKSIEAIFSGTQWLTAAELGRAARPKAANPHSVASRWRASKRIYAVERRGQLLFARYQFDAGFDPLPVVARILATLEQASPIEIASWFESPNSYLDGSRPRDLLASEPELVAEAAADSLVAATHG